MNIRGVLAGLGYWIFSILMAYYLLIQPSKKINIYGVILLSSNILIPALIVSTSWPTMVDHFIALLEEYPFLHIPLFIIAFIICFITFIEFFPEEMYEIITPASEKILAFCVAAIAAASSYYFFIFVIAAAGTAVALIAVSAITATYVIFIAKRTKKKEKGD